MIFDRFRKQKERPTGGSGSPGPSPSGSDPAAESREFLTGDADIDRRSLQLLLDTMAEVGTTLELDRLLVDLVDKSIETTRSERGFLLLVDESAAGDESVPGTVEPTLAVRVARMIGGKDIPLETNYSTTVARKVFSTGVPIANVVQSSQQALDLAQSVYDLKLRAVMCVPLESRGQRYGAIYVDSRAERLEFTRRDLAFFAALSQQLAVSLDNARLYTESVERARLSKELELARHIQKQLLPDPTDLPADLDAELWYEAAGEASGDTYDFLVGSDDSVCVLIGDVSGHGIGPALIAHSAQAAVTSYLEVLSDPGQVLCRLDRRFAKTVEAGNFMSMFVGRIERAGDGGRQYRYVNGGHGCAWHVRKSGVEVLHTSGPALGVADGYAYESSPPIAFEPGDLLFLCSDGVTEARNPSRDLFGEGRLREVLDAAHGQGAKAVVDRLRERLQAWTDTFEDDVMLLAIAAKG
ncbi:MAG: SpoIIE family protein phosphatase [Planctomycetes bacterium]|nr:SpoIIE family protein phosphatase [Planctomycetota bacterium]